MKRVGTANTVDLQQKKAKSETFSMTDMSRMYQQYQQQQASAAASTTATAAPSFGYAAAQSATAQVQHPHQYYAAAAAAPQYYAHTHAAMPYASTAANPSYNTTHQLASYSAGAAGAGGAPSHYNTHPYSAATAAAAAAPSTAQYGAPQLPSRVVLPPNYNPVPTQPPPNCRTVYIGNLEPGMNITELFNVIRGGIVESVKYLPERNCAFVSFVDSYGALLFHQEATVNPASVMVCNKPLKAGWSKSVSAIPPHIATAISQGATRAIYIGNVPDTNAISPELLVQDMSSYGVVDAVRFMPEKKCIFVHMSSIQEAINAIASLKTREPYKNFKVNFAKDRCDRPINNQKSMNNPFMTQMPAGMQQFPPVPGAGLPQRPMAMALPPRPQYFQQQPMPVMSQALPAAPQVSPAPTQQQPPQQMQMQPIPPQQQPPPQQILPLQQQQQQQPPQQQQQQYGQQPTAPQQMQQQPPSMQQQPPSMQQQPMQPPQMQQQPPQLQPQPLQMQQPPVPPQPPQLPGQPFPPPPPRPVMMPMATGGPVRVLPVVPRDQRVIYLGGLPDGVTPMDICSTVRAGGPLLSIKLLPEKHCAFLAFVDSSSAVMLHIYSNALVGGLSINGQRISRVSWAKDMTVPRGLADALRLGATRNIYLGSIDTNTMSQESLLQDFSTYGEVEQVHIMADKRTAFVNFCTVQSAVNALEAIQKQQAAADPANNKYGVCRISYGRDRCAVEPRNMQQALAEYYQNPKKFESAFIPLATTPTQLQPPPLVSYQMVPPPPQQSQQSDATNLPSPAQSGDQPTSQPASPVQVVPPNLAT